MSILKNRLAEQIPELRAGIRSLLDEHGDHVISKVTVAQAFGGMRGVRGLICDTSLVEPDKGLLIRGYPIGEIEDITAEECFHLLLTGERPDADAVEDLRRDWVERADVPSYVWDVLDSFPEGSHPMTLFAGAVLAMQRESRFAAAYAEGVARDDYWLYSLEDAHNLIARLPGVASGIYRMLYGKGERVRVRPDLDWGANFAHLLGISESSPEFAEFLRMFMVLHSDHEGGNVSAHAATVVGSALSDQYQSLCAGLNGLAGPLHGLANQQCLGFVLDILERFDGNAPSKEVLRAFCWERLESGRVIPGYGHAVLRCPDPRFVSIFKFGQKRCPDSPVFDTVQKLYETVPGVLEEQGKAKNPFPNVDAVSGSLLHHYGLTEIRFYTVLFGVSRALGIAAQQILARALGFPLERPKSVGTQWVRETVTAGK